MTERATTFGISIAEIFQRGVRGYLSNVVPLSGAAAVTLGTYLAFRFPAQAAFEAGDTLRSIGIDLVGLVLASVLAYPWYSFALDAADGKRSDWRRPFTRMDRFAQQAVASFWFWAAVLLGLRYLFGIPSILALLFYAFYGYVVADTKPTSGLKALGTSVRLGEGKRIGLLALAALFAILNIAGALAVGFDVNPATIALAFAGVVATSSVTLVAGAGVYRTLQSALKEGQR